MNFLLGRPIFRGHVSFREGNPSKFSWNLNITQFEKETHLNQTSWKRSHILYTIWHLLSRLSLSVGNMFPRSLEGTSKVHLEDHPRTDVSGDRITPIYFSHLYRPFGRGPTTQPDPERGLTTVDGSEIPNHHLGWC